MNNVVHRWPTVFALAFAAVNLWDRGSGLELAFLLLVPPLTYLFAAVADRPRVSWPAVAALVGVYVVLKVLDLGPWVALGVTGAALIALGLITGVLRRPGLAALQSPAAVVFVLIGLLALTAPAPAGSWLVAGGLLLHASWDFVHLRRNRVVVRSFSEWCGVLDATLAVGIMIVTVVRG